MVHSAKGSVSEAPHAVQLSIPIGVALVHSKMCVCQVQPAASWDHQPCSVLLIINLQVASRMQVSTSGLMTMLHGDHCTCMQLALARCMPRDPSAGRLAGCKLNDGFRCHKRQNDSTSHNDYPQADGHSQQWCKPTCVASKGPGSTVRSTAPPPRLWKLYSTCSLRLLATCRAAEHR